MPLSIIGKPSSRWISTGSSQLNRFTRFFSNETTDGTGSEGEDDGKPKFGRYEIVTPGKISDGKREVPDRILRPDYYFTGNPKPFNKLTPEERTISSPGQMDKFRAACKLARLALRNAIYHTKVGVTTEYIDNITHEFILSLDAYPSPLNYRGFPKSICTSVNNVAIHGIPDDRPLADGDIVNLDVTVFWKGFHGDCSETVLVGDVDKAGRDLVIATKHCLDRAVYVCAPGVPFYKIGSEIEACARLHRMTVIPVITGHGIGQFFHGEPDIFHVEYPYPGKMKPGMTFTIEPVLSQGGEDVKTLKDGWTTVTTDDARTAQFEHTILITNTGFEVLTAEF